MGQDTIARSLRCVRRRGTCVLFGISSGPVSSVSPFDLAEAGSIFFTRPYLADYLASAEEVRWRTQDLFELLKGGKLEVTIDREVPLDRAAAAHRSLETRRTRGKLLLEVND